MIYFFPTKAHIAEEPYHFVLTGTNACEKSNAIHFQVSVTSEKLLPCFLFDAVFHRSTKHMCVLEHLETFQIFLSHKLPQKTFGKAQIISSTVKNDQVIISFTVWKGKDCSLCTQNYIDDVKDRLSVHNLKTQNRYFGELVLQNVYVSSGCLCTKHGDRSNIKAVSFIAQAGVINKIDVPGFKTSSPGLLLPVYSNHLSCFVEHKGKQQLWFLPFSSVLRDQKLKEDDVVVLKSSELTECDVGSNIRINIDNRLFQGRSCYSLTVKVSTTKETCILQTVEDVISSISKRVKVARDYIIITKHAVKTGETKTQQALLQEILLQLSFSSECNHECSYILLKSHTQQALHYHQNVKTKTHDGPKFVIHNITFNECRFDAGAFGILHTSRSFVPLWIYLLPAFFVLFLLFIFFLVCCCCCRSKYGYCCYRKRQAHRVLSSYPPMNLIECKRYISPANSGIQEASAINTSKESSSAVLKSATLNTTAISKNDASTYATIEVSKEKAAQTSSNENGTAGASISDPVVKQSTTTTTRETIYSRKYINNEHGQPNAANTTMEKFYVKQPVYTTINDDVHDNNQVRRTSKRTSRRIRSYSDGFILDELNLPSPPCNNSRNPDCGMHTHRRLCRADGHKSKDDISLCVRRKVTIPFKMTARVKNVSKSCDDVITASRPRYAKFNETTSYHDDSRPATIPRRKIFVECDGYTPFRAPSFNKDSSTTKRYVVESWKDNRIRSNDELFPTRPALYDVTTKKDKGRVVFLSSTPSRDVICSKPQAAKRYVKMDNQYGTSEC